MKLAIYADSKGQIAGLAVCRAIFHDDMNGPVEISIRAEPIQRLDAVAASEHRESFTTHLIDLPPHLVNKSHYELSEALHEIHASMRLDVTQSVPCLCERTKGQ
jgi:hypothetical protein